MWALKIASTTCRNILLLKESLAYERDLFAACCQQRVELWRSHCRALGIDQLGQQEFPELGFGEARLVGQERRIRRNTRLVCDCEPVVRRCATLVLLRNNNKDAMNEVACEDAGIE